MIPTRVVVASGQLIWSAREAHRPPEEGRALTLSRLPEVHLLQERPR